jgi:molecular chaperone GrpE (heat shock protein)
MAEIDLPVTVAPEPAAGEPISQATSVPGAVPGAITDAPSSGNTSSERQAALRALRSLEATEARLERNARREVEDARGKLIQDLLPVLDNLDRTIQAAQGNRRFAGDPVMLQGVRMVRQQLDGVLRGYGAERIDAIDQAFDPSLHEAVGVVAVADPRRHGVVIDQVEPGYRMAGKLLRPARVNVGKLAAPVDTSLRMQPWNYR